MADRNEPVPCEGTVNELVSDSLANEAANVAKEWPGKKFVVNGVPIEFVSIYEHLGDEAPEPEPGVEDAVVAVRKVPCILKAKLIIGTTCNLDHGRASNRDAAREGRYDPLNPNRRFISKGRREWRRT